VRASAPSLWTMSFWPYSRPSSGHRRSWGRRSCKVPGCLKSESEERETWTAESLRAAFREGKPRAKTVRKRLRRSTFQVNTWSLECKSTQVTGDGPRQTL
jgi:hypothetical protein